SGAQGVKLPCKVPAELFTFVVTRKQGDSILLSVRMEEKIFSAHQEIRPPTEHLEGEAPAEPFPAMPRYARLTRRFALHPTSGG
ncbi:MAG: hypothetical protein NZ741_12875, partial [Armatimonadetes bacterium]|nr:hypothetical protein [Armatimonadota bacterium]